MQRFLDYVQKRYNYTDYQIKIIRYFFMCMGSDCSKLLIILGFSAIIGRFLPCIVALAALVLLRTSGGGFHCERYITCLLFSFAFTFGAIFLAEYIKLIYFIAILSMLLSLVVAYILVPIVSYHRPEPPKELIKHSRIINFCFLIFCTFAVAVFHNNPYCILLTWVCILHTVQLLLAYFCRKGGKYHVSVFNGTYT